MKISPKRYNVFFAIISHFLMGFSASWAIIKVLYYQNIGLSYFQISIVLSIASITTLILEIPTGYFADKYGRKTSIILSFLTCFVAAILLIYSTNIYWLISVSILYGISFGLWSGSYESLIYESTNKNIYYKILSRTDLLFVITTALSMLITPYLYNINVHYPFYMVGIISIILLTMSSFLNETLKKHPTTEYNILKNLKEIKEIIKNNNFISFLIIQSVVWGSSISIIKSLFLQPLIFNNYSMENYGFLFFLTTIMQSLILFKREKIIELLKNHNYYLILFLVWFVSFVLFLITLKNIYIAILFLSINWSVSSIIYVLNFQDINKEIKENHLRATIISINSMTSSLSFFIFVNIFGYFLTNENIIETVSILLFITLLISIFIFKKYKKIL